MDRISQEAWLERRPYLRPVADFHAQVALAAASIPITGVHFTSWDSYSGDYRAGVPLLRSSRDQSTLSLRPLSSHRLSRVWLQNPSQKNWRRRLEFWTLNCGPTWTRRVG